MNPHVERIIEENFVFPDSAKAAWKCGDQAVTRFVASKLVDQVRIPRLPPVNRPGAFKRPDLGFRRRRREARAAKSAFQEFRDDYFW